YKGNSGTCINSVFDHMRESNPGRSLIVTDGYTVEITDSMLRDIDRRQVFALITPLGKSQYFRKQGIPHFRLKPIT
ncbi:MAG: hypothetical protein EA409_09325, partial [Saprospirales bacterium]